MSKREAKQKPVWKVNAGNGFPNDAKPFGEAMFRGGSCVELDCEPDEYYWHIDGCSSDITAYQTNRTRETKYDRVECGYCKGAGVLYHEEESNNNLKCYCCNGKGYRLEAL